MKFIHKEILKFCYHQGMSSYMPEEWRSSNISMSYASSFIQLFIYDIFVHVIISIQLILNFNLTFSVNYIINTYYYIFQWSWFAIFRILDLIVLIHTWFWLEFWKCFPTEICYSSWSSMYKTSIVVFLKAISNTNSCVWLSERFHFTNTPRPN